MKLIIGKLNRNNIVYYWRIPSDSVFTIGDYAIVENINDYDLVKIIGIVETEEKYAKFLANGKEISKKVIYFIERKDIRED